MPLSHREAIVHARRLLEQAEIAEAGLEAQLLLAHVISASRTWLLTQLDQPLTHWAATVYRALVFRRARREPFAYITGLRTWLDLTLLVDRNVLIPRPETEILAQLAMAELRGMDRVPLVADVGTGSGALAIALARAYPEAHVVATDSSAAALRTAALNVKYHAADRIDLRLSNLLEGIAAADLVVANLPYIPTGDLAGLERELAFEPVSALDGGPDGLAPIRSLLEQAARALSPTGAILLECGYDQADRIAVCAGSHWPGAAISTERDLAGIERFVRIRLPGEAG